MTKFDSCEGATLYVTEGSGNSFKPAQALAQLNVAHRLEFVDVLAGETKTDGYIRINRLGQVPYFIDAGGFGMAESNAMLWYIAEGSLLIPESTRARAIMLQWMFFEQTRLEPNISPARFYSFVQPHRTSEFAQDIPRWQSKSNAALDLLDSHLTMSDFIVPQHGYSIGDIAVFGYVHLSHQAGLDLGSFPAVSRWIERVIETPRFVPIDVLLKRPIMADVA